MFKKLLSDFIRQIIEAFLKNLGNVPAGVQMAPGDAHVANAIKKTCDDFVA